MNVLKRELRGGFRTVLIWTLIVAGLNVMMIAFIKSFTMDAQALQEFIKAFPTVGGGNHRIVFLCQYT